MALSLAGTACVAIAGPAAAGGSLKDAPADDRKFTWSITVGGTTDYVFRGVSQNSEDPAAQGSLDLGYGIFYAGVWASNINFDDAPKATAEVDWYFGIKPVWGPLTFDFGGIYYSYPGAGSAANFNGDVEGLNYFELKAGVSATPLKNLTLGVTGYYSPDYAFSTGAVWTVEGTAAYELPKFWIFTPTIGGTFGYQKGDSGDGYSVDGTAKDDYTYWNAGLTLAVDKITLDFRYWDTNIGTAAGGTVCANTGLCDERFVFSAKITLP
jgi:uncharacterized protein (TIGR02001 family)